jgi:hypothetical protein
MAVHSHSDSSPDTEPWPDADLHEIERLGLPQYKQCDHHFELDRYASGELECVTPLANALCHTSAGRNAQGSPRQRCALPRVDAVHSETKDTDRDSRPVEHDQPRVTGDFH